MIKLPGNARRALAIDLPNLILMLPCDTVFARHNRNLRLQLKELPNSALCTFAACLRRLILVLTCDTILARHKRCLPRSGKFTGDARIALAVSQTRHIRVLARAAVLARHSSGLRHLFEELARNTQRVLTCRLASLILVLPGPTRNAVRVGSPCRATIGDRATTDVARIARTS